MIRLHLGPEPVALTRARPKRLKESVAAFNLHGPGNKEFVETLDGYDTGSKENSVKRALWDRQRKKCAWCEWELDWEMMPVEHIRPKRRADDVDSNDAWTVQSPDHYWWLTWTWENLVFSCSRCNGTENKGNKFPMAPGTPRVPAPTRPLAEPVNWTAYDTSNEQPLLVNPREEDPLVHLTWEPLDRTLPWDEWKWDVKGRTVRGAMTVRVLGLKGRLDRVQDHLRVIIQAWKQVWSHLKDGRRDDAREAWEDILRLHIENDRARFRAAAWCALEALLPADRRGRR